LKRWHKQGIVVPVKKTTHVKDNRNSCGTFVVDVIIVGTATIADIRHAILYLQMKSFDVQNNILETLFGATTLYAATMLFGATGVKESPTLRQHFVHDHESHRLLMISLFHLLFGGRK
jgi:hypothetical protein